MAATKTKKVATEAAEPKDVYVVVNETLVGKTTLVTSVNHVRGLGSFVRETVLDEKGNAVSVSVVFVPAAKVKTKKGVKSIILDKGPKPKKGKKGTESEEDEDEE